MDIDIRQLDEIRLDLEDLTEDEVIRILEDSEERFVILSSELYHSMEDIVLMVEEAQKNPIRIVKDGDVDLSYEEYEAIKEQLVDILEQILLPKPEKLN